MALHCRPPPRPDPRSRSSNVNFLLDPDSVAAKINLATALMDQLEVNRAIEFFQKIVAGVALGDELPEHALAHKTLGHSLLLKGKYEDGIRHDAWRW